MNVPSPQPAVRSRLTRPPVFVSWPGVDQVHRPVLGTALPVRFDAAVRQVDRHAAVQAAVVEEVALDALRPCSPARRTNSLKP